MQCINCFKSMSIDANIQKKWLVKSPNVFLNFIKDRDELLNSQIEFRVFRDHLFLSKYGCECTSKENEEVSVSLYKQFDKIKPDVWIKVKEIIGCNAIIFQYENENLFEV